MSAKDPSSVHLARLAPHEFNDRGDPSWNVNPRVVCKGEKVVIGFTHSRRYSVTGDEAFQLARALIDAAIHTREIKKEQDER